MYQEQKLLKEQMKELLDKEGRNGNTGKSVLNEMEELERILLEKGITRESLERMQKLEHELLEMENANMKRNQDNKRKSETNLRDQELRDIEGIEFNSEFGRENETLKRKALELSPDYKQRVKEYFELDKS
jgi:serine phosphatase RsbU (regulator of sigma subunit)